MASNHGFVDGNKRTTLILVNTLIIKTNYCWYGVDIKKINSELEELILEAAKGRTGRYDHAVTVAWFKARVRPRD